MKVKGKSFNKKKPGKPGKFNKPNKFKSNDGKPKVKKSVQEDDEIKTLQESYENLPEFKNIKSFNDFPLSKKTRKGLLANKYRIPTEIQKQSIGLALQGKDILGAAQTGSGKTLGKHEKVKHSTVSLDVFSSFSFPHTDSGESLLEKVDTHRWSRCNHHLTHERAGVSDFRDFEESRRAPRVFKRFDHWRKKSEVREDSNGSVQHRYLHARTTSSAHGREPAV